MTQDQALRNVIAAWKKMVPLPGEQTVYWAEIESWLQTDMWRAVNDCREALGIERTDKREEKK